MRVAILATPRSGNTWLRSLLGSLYDLTHIVCDRPEDVPWHALPPRCVVQLHWNAEPRLVEQLREHQVCPITIARHPCDVLISILHFCTTWSRTSLWFGGESGNEDTIRGCLPTSAEFQRYASGPRARSLLDITCGWWQLDHCLKVRYEDLVADPPSELLRLSAGLEPRSPEQIDAACAANGFERLKGLVENQHYWSGNPGHWKRFITPALSEQVARVHHRCLHELGYACDADAALTVADADRNWLALECVSLRLELSRTRRQLLDATGSLQEAQRLLGELDVCRRMTNRAGRLARRLGLHPKSEGLAGVMRSWMGRAPKKAA
ncbi:MAG: sulfotransferase domain-containing protein [Planctomycetaceae bacterium]